MGKGKLSRTKILTTSYYHLPQHHPVGQDVEQGVLPEVEGCGGQNRP